MTLCGKCFHHDYEHDDNWCNGEVCVDDGGGYWDYDNCNCKGFVEDD